MGKSYSVRAWASASNLDLLEINFEEEPRFQKLFAEDLNPERVLDELSLLKGKNPRQPGVLLFLDEVQTAPLAITALRYFYEKMPEIPIIAAGSLIEFVLQEQGFPVGRVESLYMFPLTFFEFVAALGKESLRDFLAAYVIEGDGPVPDLVHSELLSLLRLYYQVGGMPKVVSTYLESRDFAAVSREQGLIIKGYRDDFAKYGRQADWSTLHTLLMKVGALVGRTRVRFSSVGAEFSSVQVRRAIQLLEHALLVHRVYPTHTSALPLAAAAQTRFFKLLFLDIGLLHHLRGFDWRTVDPGSDLTDICEGRFAEQFVGQEFVATRSRTERYSLHYWDRPKSGSAAEVDYVIEYRHHSPVPVEVKSGTRGRLRSLSQYIAELHPFFAFVLSQRNREHLPDVELVPLYLACRLQAA